MPSRGVVIAGSNERYSANPLTRAFRRRRPSLGETPLRLLVIGDSLAAGVGMRKSSTPALPESIAGELSRGLNGRAVYWTCVGTPGLSSTQILEDIHTLDDLPTPLIRRLADWQAQSRQRAQLRLSDARDRAKEWWAQHKAPIEVEEEQSNRVKRWWQRFRVGFQRDLRNLRRVMEQDEEAREKLHQELERKVKRMVRRNSLEPEFVNQYDVAVVLTGLNDLKDSFLPFMMSKNRAKMIEDARKEHGEGGLKNALTRIVFALRRKTQAADQTGVGRVEGKDDTSGIERRTEKSQGPLVVFPALPVEPTVLNQLVPLNWFIVPIIRAMDRNKLAIANMHPQLVVFVESPSLSFFSQAENKSGPFWKDALADGISLRLTDVAQHVKDRVEDLMHAHYETWLDGNADDDLYELEVDSVIALSYEPERTFPGASLVSADGIHPNDEGYEVWGRYIAQNILDRVKKETRK